MVEKKQKAKHISHGDFRLKIQTRFQSRHSVNIYSPTAYIHTHTHKMSSTDALTTAGRHLLSFDFTSNNDHLHDFEWSASSSSFVLYSLLSLFYPRELFQCVSGFSRYRRCVRTSRAARHREHKTTPLRRTATMRCHRLSLV